MTELKNDTVSVTINNEVTIQGFRYAPGTHKVPADVAEDLARIDKNYITYELGLNKNESKSGSLGSISAA